MGKAGKAQAQAKAKAREFPPLRDLAPEAREAFLASLDVEELAYVEHSWDFWAREDQVEPEGDWYLWTIWAGRFWGKTLTGAQTLAGWARRYPGTYWGAVSGNLGDVRETMVEGQTGILQALRPRDLRGGSRDKAWNRGSVELFLSNGSVIRGYSAEAPEDLRGPNLNGMWADEPAKWRDADRGWASDSTWSNLMFANRVSLPDGRDARGIVTGTPRPVKLVRELMAMARAPDSGVVRNEPARASSYQNRGNISKAYQRVLSKYEGTRLGRQEIGAELLDDTPGALWKAKALNDLRRPRLPLGVDLVRVVVAVDPAGSIADMARFAAGLELEDRNDGDDAGIVCAGLGSDGHGYVLEDATTGGSPATWGRAAAWVYRKRAADRALGESNHGGANVEKVLRAVDPALAYRKVFASRGKAIRAEPVAALYERGLVHHVGEHAQLEDEMATWEPGRPSPNRMDALVIALTDLMLDQQGTGEIEVEDDPWDGARF